MILYSFQKAPSTKLRSVKYNSLLTIYPQKHVVPNLELPVCLQIMIIDFKLTYPSGTATAHLINSFHTPEGAKLAK